MSTANLDSTGANRLFAVLRASNTRRLLGEASAAAMRHVGLLIAALVAALVIDAALGLDSAWLIALDVVLLSLIALGLGRLLVVAWRRRFHPQRAAVHLERSVGIDDGRLVTAVDLATRPSSAESPALRAYAVAEADGIAANLSADAAVDRHDVWAAARVMAVAVAVMGVGYAMFPGVFHAVIPRLLQPTADHPPFTLLRFDASTEPEQVIYGKRAAIRVAIAGPMLPEQATLVWVNEDGSTERVPMLRGAKPQASAEASSDEEEARHFVLRLDRPTASRAYYVDTPGGRSERFRFEVVPVPLFERVSVRYEFPQYTGWSPKSEPLSSAGIKALEGAKVTLDIASNVPVEDGELRLTPKEGSAIVRRFVPSTDLAYRERGQFFFNMPVNGSGEFEAVLRSGGLATPEPLRGRVTAIADAPPEISFDEPVERVMAPEGWNVDVKVSARDDIGVSRVVLHRGVNGLTPTPLDLQTTGRDSVRREAAYRFDLTQLGARAGDVITYFATVWDNKPQPQSAQTPVYVIQVVSEAEYEDYARTQYRIDDLSAEWEEFAHRLDELQAKREHALNELAKLQEAMAAGGPLTPEQQAAAEQLEAELEQYRQEALELFEDMQKRAEQNALYDFEEAYKDQLSRTGQELQMQASEADALARAMREARQDGATPEARERLAMQAERFRERDQPFDQQMQQEREQLAEDLAKVQLADEMMGAAERIQSVIEQQRDLATRMQQFAAKESLTPQEQSLANKLAQEQGDLRRELDDARDTLRDAAERAKEQLPKMSGSAQTLCERLDALDAQADQLAAEQEAMSGRGPGAAAGALAAADKLESLLGDCQATGDASGELDGCLSLSRESWKQAMGQMKQGRGMAGMRGQGGQGGGSNGSMARMAVVGPSPRGQGQGPGRSSQRTAQGQGGAPASADDDAGEGGEQIDAEAATERTRGVTTIQGVPQRYREAAEAYFQRLAEDEAGRPYNGAEPGGQP